MDDLIDADGGRPSVRCLAARVERDDQGRPVRLGNPMVVLLVDAAWWINRGFWIVGPDPFDIHELAIWERNQQP